MKKMLYLPFVIFCFLVFPAEGVSQEGIGKTLEEVEKLAAKEGKLRFGAALRPFEVKMLVKGFNKKYPMIKVEHTRVRGREAEAVYNEATVGMVRFDLYDVPRGIQQRFEKGGLLVPVKWQKRFPDSPKIHFSPYGHFYRVEFHIRGIAYNPTLVPPERVPKSWSDCLDPHWKGRVAVDTKPRAFRGMYEHWGKEKTLKYASDLKNNKPIWFRGQTTAMTQLGAGEFALICGANYATVRRILNRAAEAPVAFAVPHEVPVDTTGGMAVLKGSQNPNAAVLLGGWLGSPEGQKIYDKIGRSSPFQEGTGGWKVIQEAGAKRVFQDLENERIEEIEKTILAAFDFPVAR